MNLSPHTFPLWAYPGPAPESPARLDSDAWGPYALAAPSDRLLPFVLTRRQSRTNSPWLSCAWLEHAGTGERVVTLAPTGTSLPVPALGLPLTKLVDAASQAEHFTYDGALIPGLAAVVPCGVPLRLVLDNAYQGPRFFALAPAARLALTHLLLEWHHPAPLPGVPYGRGLRQRFYLENGRVQHLDPREEQVVSKDPDSGVEVTLSLSLFAQGSLAVPPVPDYLAQAFSAARAVRTFAAEGTDWRLLSTKAAPTLDRQSLALTLESREPLLRRGCASPALPLETYVPATSAPRGWRCGDASDTASDYQPTGVFACELAGGANTGYVLETLRDLNRYSPSYGTETTRRSADQDLTRCPLPVVYHSAAHTIYPIKDDCPSGQTGSTVTYTIPYDAFQSSVSQNDADGKAQAYAQATKRAYANANGTCQAAGSYVPRYESTGCFACTMVNSADGTDERDATADEIAQYYKAFAVQPEGDKVRCARC